MPNITPADIGSFVALFERETGCCPVDREGFAHKVALALWSGLPKRFGEQQNRTHLAALARHLNALVATFDQIPLYPIAAHELDRALGALFLSDPERHPLAVVRDRQPLAVVRDDLPRSSFVAASRRAWPTIMIPALRDGARVATVKNRPVDRPILNLHRPFYRGGQN